MPIDLKKNKRTPKIVAGISSKQIRGKHNVILPEVIIWKVLQRGILAALGVSLLLLTGCSNVSSGPAISDGQGDKIMVPAAVTENCLLDLHLHLDGSLSLASVKQLAELQNIKLTASDEQLQEQLTVAADCRDLNQYLTKFDFPLSFLQTKVGISQAVCNLQEELKEQGVIYAEIRFAPQKHCAEGLTQDEVIAAALDGLNRSDLQAGLILCCMRGDDNHAANMETVRLAAKYLGQGVCALDLAGAEALYPTADFEDLFALAQEENIPVTIHAGEAAGPASVAQAVSFGASRIGHGVRAAEDAALLQELAALGIVLELCPTSNLNTGVFNELDEYPLHDFLNAGVKITINSDNMSVSDTTVRKELQNLANQFSLTDDDIKALLLNSAEAAFIDDNTKSWLKQSINDAFASNEK